MQNKRSEWGGILRCVTSDGRNVNIAEELTRLENDYQRKLEIAKMVYKEVNQAIKKFDNLEFDICAHWDECISVDDEFFHGIHLRDENGMD